MKTDPLTDLSLNVFGLLARSGCFKDAMAVTLIVNDLMSRIDDPGRVKRMEDALIKLYDEAVLSEGQVTKITGLGRIECRRRADEMQGQETL